MGEKPSRSSSISALPSASTAATRRVTCQVSFSLEEKENGVAYAFAPICSTRCPSVSLVTRNSTR